MRTLKDVEAQHSPVSRPLAACAGLWTRWKSVQKVKEGEVEADIFGFLTIDPNAEVGAIHRSATPVILQPHARRSAYDQSKNITKKPPGGVVNAMLPWPSRHITAASWKPAGHAMSLPFPSFVKFPLTFGQAVEKIYGLKTLSLGCAIELAITLAGVKLSLKH